MKTTFITAILVLFTGMLVHSQKVETLNDIIHEINRSNPTVKMYEAQIRSMLEAAKGARGRMPVDIGTGLWMAPYNAKMWRKGDNGQPGMGQYMISVQQMFPNKKQQNAQAAYMEAMPAAENERFIYELKQRHADAKERYYALVILKKKTRSLEENERVLNFMIKDAEIRYRNGLDKLSAYYKAKAELGNIMSMKLELENEINQQRIGLNTLMNRNKLEIFDVDTTYIIKDYQSLPIDSGHLGNRSEIKAIDKDLQLTGLQQKAEAAKTKPEFGVRYEHMFGFGGLPMQYTLMGMARIPFGRANSMSRANVESLKWKSEALAQQKQLLLNEASGKAAALINEMVLKKNQVKLFEETIIPALRKNYQVIQLGYQQNTEDLFTLFDAWDTLNKTQSSYLSQLQQLLGMQVEFERVMEIN
ncbi:MAG TPA: TolC family protein [Chitinophagaceae bacterium]|nr:TolC family protein [Chitinophagaceae bacterium]